MKQKKSAGAQLAALRWSKTGLTQAHLAACRENARKGGRPPGNTPRCPCGRYALTSARQNGHQCELVKNPGNDSMGSGEKAMKAKEIERLLQHAAWHCRFGSERYTRTPTSDDIAAAELLERLRKSLKDAERK